ncbi:hypothetical protein G6011_00030 [Alternaria panax]|uniref:RNase III domain-containing protein n=1 Tax=Alternaria panax TaxID=48097 RepID=A0AAD4IHU1_9PLEO|nr:hypothetical protein G6011_00030 [Alternaria panax]
MAETCYAVVVEKARLNDINRRKYWWKDKKKVAEACEALGLEPHIVRSARQTGQVLSPEVLNYTLNAVIGAVWLDCQAQNKNIRDTCDTVSKILSHINSILNLSTAVSGNQNGFLVATHNVSVFPAKSATRVTLESNLGSDLDGTETPADFETYESFSVFPPDAFSEVLNNLMTEQWPPQQSVSEQQPSLGYDITELNSQGDDQVDVTRSSSSGTQGVSAQSVFSIQQETVIEPIMPGAADTSVPIARKSRRALPGEGSGNPVGAQLTCYSQRKTKRVQTERDKASAVLESLLDVEQQKIGAYPGPRRAELQKYLEYPRTTQLKDPCHLFRFLYLAIGSWDTLADFASQLQSAREGQRFFALPFPVSSTASMIFNTMCRLDNERTTCTLLKRYCAVQLLEEGQRSSQSWESMHMETLETFGVGSTQKGNPQMLRDAAEIKYLVSKIAPGVEDTSKVYSTVYLKVKRFRQLGKRLQILTKPFGVGILALLPSGSSFPCFSLTDYMLLDVNKTDLNEFAMLLEEKQGPLLRNLSSDVAPALSALAALHQGHYLDSLPSLIGIESLRDKPKALLTLSPNFSNPIVAQS